MGFPEEAILALKAAALLVSGFLGKMFLDKVTRQNLYATMTKSMTDQQKEISDLRIELTEYVAQMNSFHLQNGELMFEVQKLTQTNERCVELVNEIKKNSSDRIHRLEGIIDELKKKRHE